MRLLLFLPLITLSTAFVIPSQEVLEAVAKDYNKKNPEYSIQKEREQSRDVPNPLDITLDSLTDLPAEDSSQGGFDIESWVNRLMCYARHRLDDGPAEAHSSGQAKEDEDDEDDDDEVEDTKGKFPFPIPHLPFPPHLGHPSNKTIYHLLSTSKYTTRLAKIIDEDHSLVKLLNSTDADHANLTLFAPTDHAFAKLPEHLPEPSKKALRAALRYHLVDGVFSALDVFHHRTVPSLLKEDVSGYDLPQRLAVRAGLGGLKVNFYSRMVAVDIGASNGLIHGIDSILLPPPASLALFNIVPTQFSTFTLGLLKTGLAPVLEDANKRVTIFAPSNKAFENLGVKINAFLFSAHGAKYLRALLQYHIVQNQTLFSDVFYTPDGHIRGLGTRGSTHLDLPTLLGHKGKPALAVDVVRFGAVSSIKLNGVNRVAFADALARDGVVHIVDHVLVPPCKGTGHVDVDVDMVDTDESELTVDDLKDRLSEWVAPDASDKIPIHDGEL